MQILIVEDDKRISDFLTRGLEEHGYMVTLCSSAEEVLEGYLNIDWGVIIVDIMLSGMDGIQLVQTLRYKNITVPILTLSALTTVNDKVNALDSGADDYLTKPFHFDELLSRIKALTRRVNQLQADNPSEAVKTFNGLTIDMNLYQVSLEGEPIDLSPKEFRLLTYLVDNVNKAVSRLQILNAVWGITFENHTNIVDVYISYLRSKIEKGNQKYIHTIKGVGYIFKD